MTTLLTNAVNVFFKLLYILIIIRVFMSWVPNLRYTTIGNFIVTLTDPILGPVKRMMDKSPARRRNDARFFSRYCFIHIRYYSDDYSRNYIKYSERAVILIMEFINKNALLKSYYQPDEKLLLAKVLDQADLSLRRHIITFSDFLSPAETAQAVQLS